MVDQPTPIEDLKTFRALLVDERRDILRTALRLREANNKGEPSGMSKGWAADVRLLQDQIQAIDRAMSDEERLELSFFQSDGTSA